MSASVKWVPSPSRPDIYDEYRIFKGTEELWKFPPGRILHLCIIATSLMLTALVVNFVLLTLAGVEQRARDFKQLGDRPYYWRSQ